MKPTNHQQLKEDITQFWRFKKKNDKKGEILFWSLNLKQNYKLAIIKGQKKKYNLIFFIYQ